MAVVDGSHREVMQMWELARRNLLRERTRLAISVSGVALSVVLMLSLTGLYNGYQERIESYFGGIDADLWVVQAGTSNFFHSSSVLAAGDEASIEAIGGVEAVRPYVSRQVAFTNAGSSLVTSVVGVEPGGRVPASARVVAGDAVPGPGEIVLDRVLANTGEIELGDRIGLRGLSFRVVGLTSGTDMVTYQYSFVALEDAQRLQGTRSLVNFFLVTVRPGAEARAVSAAVRGAVPDAEVWTPTRVVSVNEGFIEDAFLPVIRVILLIGAIVGASVIGLMTYSGVLEKRREYGVLKALGAGFPATLRLVLIQAGIAGAAGYVLGVAISLGIARWVPDLVPQLAIELEPRHILWLVLGIVGMVVVSVVPPLRRLARIDPAEVFSA